MSNESIRRLSYGDWIAIIAVLVASIGNYFAYQQSRQSLKQTELAFQTFQNQFAIPMLETSEKLHKVDRTTLEFHGYFEVTVSNNSTVTANDVVLSIGIDDRRNAKAIIGAIQDFTIVAKEGEFYRIKIGNLGPKSSQSVNVELWYTTPSETDAPIPMVVFTPYEVRCQQGSTATSTFVLL